MKSKVLIVTRGRPWPMQVTAQALSLAGIQYTFVRTVGDEIVIESPYQMGTIWLDAAHIAIKRQKVLGLTRRFIMLDDDLSFQKVIEGKAVKATSEDLRTLFALWDKCLNHNALVGLENRFMIQNKEQPFNTKWGKMIHAVGINKRYLVGDERYDRVPGHEDIDFFLQVATNGCPVTMISAYTHSDAGNFYRAGGCSTWRNKENDHERALQLAALWPGIIDLYPGKDGITRVKGNWKRVRNINARNLRKKKRTV